MRLTWIFCAGLLSCAPLVTPGADVAPAPNGALRLMILPADDLSGGRADLRAVDAAFEARLVEPVFETISNDEMLAFLRRHRMRHTGGARIELLAAMRKELSAEIVFISSVDQFVEELPPRVGLSARFVDVSTGQILWSREVSLAGEQRPGVLGLGEINDVYDLLDHAADQLLDRISEPLIRERTRATPTWKHANPARRYRPRKSFRSPSLDAGFSRPARVAVVPFENRSRNSDAGEMIAGLLGTHLAGREQIELLEPGEVRAKLLQGRVIQNSGLSLAQADLLREMLNVDLVVTGEILDLSDRGRTATPHVAFSIWVVDVHRRTVVWSGYSSNHGDDGVVFFDIGRVETARALLSHMVRSATNEIARAIPDPAQVAGNDQD